MHVPEGDRELERQRKQREIRTHSRTRPEPAHRRHALRVSPGRTIPPGTSESFSNNVTLRQLGGVAIHLRCCQKSPPRCLGRELISPPADGLRRHAPPPS